MKTSKLLFLLAVSLYGLQALALNIEDSSVYRIYNTNTKKYMSVNSSGAIGAEGNDTDLKQQWFVTMKEDSSGYYLRNVATGAYLTSPLAVYTQWPMTYTTSPEDRTMLMHIEDFSEYITIRAASHTASNAYAHNQSSGSTIVCWSRSAAPSSSLWEFVKVEKTREEMDDILDSFTNVADEIAKNDTYDAYLDSLFVDKARTQLKLDITLADNSNYTRLPLTLRKMVDKIAANDWSETDVFDEKTADWADNYARKYRVQLYEPYSEGSPAALMAGIQAYTNMNNPTGIVGDAGHLVYVMVEDEIPEGATLYINGATGGDMFNSTTAGTKLHKGLNTILCTEDNAHFFIYYSVNTVSVPSGESRYQPVTAHNLKNYQPIKIHIEGGRINGFFNPNGDELYAGDTQADFEYTATRATHQMYDLVGKYVILHFHLFDTPSHPGETNQKGVLSSLLTNRTTGAGREYDPVKIMEAWDNMCFAERILMGIQSDDEINSEYNRGYYESIANDGYTFETDSSTYIGFPAYHYDEYFNNRMMGISQQGDLYMNATSWRTAYNVSTIDAILTLFCNGDIWGPAHEYGHMNQTPMNMAGTTEESNNIFSNVALYFTGASTSRCDFMSNQLKLYLQDKTFLEHSTWGTTRMFWQLWCYYHATGHNKKFYPRLYELLRRYPIRKTTVPGQHNELYDKLHFAKMCCIAAGEDLTDFFTAWGFFVPLNGYFIDDYSQYNAYLSQEDIDACKAEIKSYGFKENRAIILIDDRPESDKPSHSEFRKERAGELGGLKAFDRHDTPSGDYGFTVEGTVITVTKAEDATPGVGFLVYDNNGKLLAFSNAYSFEVTSGIIDMLMGGTAYIVAVGADEEQSSLQVTNTMLDGSLSQKVDMLKAMIELFENEMAFVDETETKVGYYYADKAADLIEWHDIAVELLEAVSGDTIPENAGAIISEKLVSMQEVYNSLKSNDEARIRIADGNTYRFTNKNYPTRVMTAGKDVCSSAVHDNAVADPYSSQWIFEAVSPGANKYYIRNAESGLYIGYTSDYNTSMPLTETPEYAFTVIEKSTGMYIFSYNGATGNCLHHAANGTIVRWSDSDASIWNITMIKTAEFMDRRAQLDELIGITTEMLERGGQITPDEAYEVDYSQICDVPGMIYTNAPYTKNNNADTFHTWSVLFDTDSNGDADVNTYFHSDYSGNNSLDGLDHYIMLRAPGLDESFRHVKIQYITRNIANTGTNPRTFHIDASSDSVSWHTAYTKTNAPTGQAITVTTDEFAVVKGTKFIRFTVSQSGGSAGGHAYFVLSDLKVFNRTDGMTCIPDNETYPHLTEGTMAQTAATLNDSREIYFEPASSLDDVTLITDALNEALQGLIAEMNKITDGVESIAPDNVSDGSVIYYDLRGIRRNSPEHGIYIKRHGNTVSKIRN